MALRYIKRPGELRSEATHAGTVAVVARPSEAPPDKGHLRAWFAGAALLVAATAAVVLLVAGGGASPRVTTGSPALFRSMLEARLTRLGDNYHWVACIPNGRFFEGVRIVRCNVDFGEPHIEAFCSVLRGGQLLTSQEDPAIPCGHDNAGMYTPVTTYN